MRQRENGNSIAIVIIVIVIVAILGVLGFVFLQHTNGAKTNTTQSPAQSGSASPSENEVATKSDCLTYEKLCFDYPTTWSLQDKTTAVNSTDGFPQGDHVVLTAPEIWLSFDIQTGVDGIGGTCAADDPNLQTVFVQEGIPIKGMTGFKSDYAKSSDQLYIAKIVTHDSANAPYIPYVYVTNNTDYVTKGVLTGLIGTCFSNFVPGRNTAIPDSDPVRYGLTTFGMTYQANGTTILGFRTLSQAEAQFDAQPYKEAISILSSLHY